ncbi:hypothetical protein FHG87_005315 [Trinorchestia longiramus]|nr:hypothetical protein FHG87_005315 [Trinorchestia longiramus]
MNLLAHSWIGTQVPCRNSSRVNHGSSEVRTRVFLLASGFAHQSTKLVVSRPSWREVDQAGGINCMLVLHHQLGRLVSESACERKDLGSNPAADMVDAARNTAWDLGINCRDHFPPRGAEADAGEGCAREGRAEERCAEEGRPAEGHAGKGRAREGVLGKGVLGKGRLGEGRPAEGHAGEGRAREGVLGKGVLWKGVVGKGV